jgi:hypothetical protein
MLGRALELIEGAASGATLFAKSMAFSGALSAASADALMIAAAATAKVVRNTMDASPSRMRLN